MIGSDFLGFLVEGFGLGIATGLGCVAHCGPVYAPLLMQKKMSLWESIFMVLEISAGRFIAYITFGMIVGTIGKKFMPNNDFLEIFMGVSFLVLSIMMIMAALGYRREEKGCSRNKMMKFSNAPFLIGLITGIHICPSFLIALTNGLATKGALGGAMLFFGFYMGTNIWLMPFSAIGFLGNLVSVKNLRRGAMFASIGVGAWFIGKATNSFIDLANKPIVVQLLDENKLYVVAEEGEDLSYFLKNIKDEKHGEVVTLTSIDSLKEDHSFILLSPSLYVKDSLSAQKLVAPGRFIAVLPTPVPQDQGFTNNYAVRMVSFFKNRNFMMKKSGSFFSMKDMLTNKGKIVLPNSGGKKGKSACGGCPSASNCGI